MVLIGKGKYHKYQGKGQIFVFSSVSNDSQFPFNDGDELQIETVPRRKEIRIRKIMNEQRRLTMLCNSKQSTLKKYQDNESNNSSFLFDRRNGCG